MKFSRSYAIASLAVFLAFLLFSLLLLTADETGGGFLSLAKHFSDTNLLLAESLGRFPVFAPITNALLGLCLLIGATFAALGAFRLIKSKSPRGVDAYLWYLGALYALTVAFYLFFEVLPVGAPSGVWAPVREYPSTHTLLAVTVLPSAALTMKLWLRRRGIRLLADLTAGASWILMAFGRLAAGEHVLTDVLGGILLGLSLVLLYAAFLLPLAEKR